VQIEQKREAKDNIKGELVSRIKSFKKYSWLKINDVSWTAETIIFVPYFPRNTPPKWEDKKFEKFWRNLIVFQGKN